MPKTRVAIAGCNGRMGRTLLEAISQHSSVTLGCAFERAGSAVIGLDATELAGLGKSGILITESLHDQENNIDVVIDFTVPEATLANLRWCAAHQKKMVIGTTGFTDEQKEEISQLAEQTAVMMAPNMSVGVNVLFKLLEVAAQVVGDHTDIEIVEAHHRFKKDAPSGTALAMGDVIADTLGRDLKQVAVYGREGIEAERSRETIGFATVRAGDIVGEHTAIFADLGERIEITHKASSRLTFANGAVRAADWICEKNDGLFNMQDVLGLK